MPYELAYWQRDSAIFLRWGSTSQITPTCLRQVDKSSNCFPNAYFCASRFRLCTALIREASFYKREWLRKRPMGTSCECSAPRATSTSTPSPKLRGYWGRKVGRNRRIRRREGALWNAVLWEWHGHCTYQRTATMACTRCVAGQVSQYSNRDELRTHEALPLAEELLAADGCWSLFVEHVVTGRLAMFQWMITHPCTYRQH